MQLRSVYHRRFIHDIVGKAPDIEARDAATGAVTTRLGYQPPRVEAMGPLDRGFLLPMTGSGGGIPGTGPQCPPGASCKG